MINLKIIPKKISLLSFFSLEELLRLKDIILAGWEILDWEIFALNFSVPQGRDESLRWRGSIAMVFLN